MEDVQNSRNWNVDLRTTDINTGRIPFEEICIYPGAFILLSWSAFNVKVSDTTRRSVALVDSKWQHVRYYSLWDYRITLVYLGIQGQKIRLALRRKMGSPWSGWLIKCKYHTIRNLALTYGVLRCWMGPSQERSLAVFEEERKDRNALCCLN